MVKFSSLLLLGGLLLSPSALAAPAREDGQNVDKVIRDYIERPGQHNSLFERTVLDERADPKLPFKPSGDDNPSLTLWTNEERATFDRGVARFGDKGPSTNAACASYAAQQITVTVHFVVHYYNSRRKLRSDGYLDAKAIAGAVARLNKDFAQMTPKVKFQLGRGTNIGPPSGIQYKYINNLTLWNSMVVDSPRSQSDLQYLINMTDTARGPFDSRNMADHSKHLFVYTVNKMPGSQVAFAFLPNSKQPFPYDGIWYSSQYFGYNYTENNSVPHALSHEVGHWLSLLHTFQTPCDTVNSATTGDLIADTPAWTQSSNYWSNVCPFYGTIGYPYDPAQIVNPCGGSQADAIASIDNTMSYSFGQCGATFTNQQQARMWGAATQFRGFVPTCLSA